MIENYIKEIEELRWEPTRSVGAMTEDDVLNADVNDFQGQTPGE